MRAEGPQGMVLHANYTCLGARARMPPRPQGGMQYSESALLQSPTKVSEGCGSVSSRDSSLQCAI